MQYHLSSSRELFSTRRTNTTFGVVVLVVYLTAQLLIGTISLEDGSYHLTSPIHMDFVYYISIAKQIGADLPPQNTSYGGIPQTQPWIHFLPLTVLSMVMNPYLSLKILNIIYVICFMLVLRKYLPDTWGLISFLFLCTSTILHWYGYPANPMFRNLVHSLRYNPASIDLLIRSFTHMPFFILFLIALFERHRTWLAVLATAGLGWVDGLMALAAFSGFLFYLIFGRDFRTLLLTVATFAGLLTYALSFGSAGGNIAETFLKNIGFEPLKPILHTYLFVPLFFWARDKKFWSLFVASFFLSCFIQFHSFHFVFPLNLATAFLAVDSLKRAPEKVSRLFNVTICIAFSLFLFYSYGKYSPGHPVDPYAPIRMKPYRSSLQWISNNTDRKAIFLILPPVTITDLSMVQQERAVYLGYSPFAKFLGINTRKRERNAYLAYKKGRIPEEVDYVYYGPRESRAFPEFRPHLPIIYKDDYVTIYDAKEETNRI